MIRSGMQVQEEHKFADLIKLPDLNPDFRPFADSLPWSNGFRTLPATFGLIVS